MHSELFPTKRPNYRRILHSRTFSPKRPNFRRISHSGHFRRNCRMNPDEFTPNFVLRDVSDETAESNPPNFALGAIPTKRPNFRRISAEFRTRARFRRNGRTSAKFRPRGRFPLKGKISAEFCTRGRFPETAEFLPNFALGDVSPETAEFPPNFALGDVSDETAEFSTCLKKRPNQSRRISVEFHTRGCFR
ncbi:MAG: hypothetical protein Q8881_02515 [Sweet potato little leaf phytoplasma]|nr:hypothetical protein [Sweet potato little leaf phytoplasma]